MRRLPEKLMLFSWIVGATLSGQPTAAGELGRGAAGSMEAVLTEEWLRVDGVTPGGEVAYLGATLEEVRESWASVQSYSGFVVDEDGNGRVVLTPKTALTGASTWVVLDVRSGEVVGVNPENFRSVLPPAMEVRVASDRRAFTVDRRDLEVLLYRPDVGVWFSKGIDGSAADDSSRADGSVRLDLRTFRSLGPAGAAPAGLLPGDRIIAVDLTHLDSVNLSFD